MTGFGDGPLPRWIAVIADGRTVVVLVSPNFAQLGQRDAFPLVPPTTGTNIADDSSIPANRVTVNGVVDGAIADAGFLHEADYLLKGFEILGRIAVQLNIADVTAVGKRVIRRFAANLLKRANREIHRNMERVGVLLTVGHAFDQAIPLAVNLHKPSGQTFGRGRNEREVEVIFLRCLVHAVPHVLDDLKAQVLCFLAFAVVDAQKCFQAFGPKPMKPQVRVPCLRTSATESSGSSFSESIHTPSPMRKG